MFSKFLTFMCCKIKIFKKKMNICIFATNFRLFCNEFLVNSSHSEVRKMFDLVSKFDPSGDQPQAIDELVKGVEEGKKFQVLLGATGTGKTFTIANVIQKTQKPTLVLAHNKTLAGQLYGELKELFPNNHVCYFVSYYDYN